MRMYVDVDVILYHMNVISCDIIFGGQERMIYGNDINTQVVIHFLNEERKWQYYGKGVMSMDFNVPAVKVDLFLIQI